MQRAVLTVTCLFLFAACGGNEEPRPGPANTAAVQPSDPQTKPGVLRIEGMEEPVTLAKVDVPEAPFTTFVPEDEFVVTSEQRGADVEVRFDAQFGGVLNPDAYVLFGFPSAGSGDSLRAGFLGPDGRFEREGWTVGASPSPCLWAEEGVVFRDEAGGAAGLLCVGTHAGAPFYLLTHHPDEYGDGFGPRLDVILDEFRWRDTGAPLRSE